MNVGNTFFEHPHWRRSALKSAGALQGGGGEFQGIFTTFNTINFEENITNFGKIEVFSRTQ